MRRASLPTRRAMTLVELLVVIGIVMILVVIAAPIMRPQLKDRKLREASRQINTFISVAKSRAAQLNRPVGFIIKPDLSAAGRSQGSFEIYLAETPIPFAGDSIGATATLTNVDANGFAHGATFADPQQLVIAGDAIQFNYMGPKYIILTATNGTITFDSPSKLPLPRGSSTQPIQVPFQVFRQPQVASDNPLELPPNTVIDLQWSGLGRSGVEMSSGSTHYTIMFSPNGAVERLYEGATSKFPEATIHLLVGRTDQLMAMQDNTSDFSKSNLLDPTVSWVSIGHLTGTVTTVENNVENPITMSAANAADIAKARTFANEKQSMGGR